jgi:hypothetical protein
MGVTADTIWQVPAYLPCVQPPLTDKAIKSAEKKIGYQLPAEYLILLKKQNGGYIRYRLPGTVHRMINGIGPYPSSLTNFDWDEDQEYVSYPLEGLVPFDGDGHWYICLDYRENSEIPSVTLADIECDDETHVADSFEEYLEKLEIDTRDEYVLEGVSDIEKIKSDLARLLGIKFSHPDTQAHGYPVHHAGMGTKDDPEWLCISPNTVPRGFVRSSDSRYTELKNLMPGTASRFPEIPAGSYLLSATDGVRLKVLKVCDLAGITIRPLAEYAKGI